MSYSRQDALDYHSSGRRGKVAVVPTKPAGTRRDLSLAYSPGVAGPCREIADRPWDVFRYTARGNLAAMVANGTAVLGLGDIGTLAARPVMEGKGVLFKRIAGIDVFDLEVGSKDPDDVIRFCELLEPTVGGINLEEVAGLYIMVLEREILFFADTTVNIDPDAGTLAAIARLAAGFARWLGIEPRVAMLSFSSFGSVRRATAVVKAADPPCTWTGRCRWRSRSPRTCGRTRTRSAPSPAPPTC
ncbi:MAG TPA: phosphate acyltransferase [Longimicrobiaceae bacterium]|nr:phosphate acyltransferase [Longimicrobiaceae bacterium]